MAAGGGGLGQTRMRGVGKDQQVWNRGGGESPRAGKAEGGMDVQMGYVSASSITNASCSMGSNEVSTCTPTEGEEDERCVRHPRDRRERESERVCAKCAEGFYFCVADPRTQTHST